MERRHRHLCEGVHGDPRGRRRQGQRPDPRRRRRPAGAGRRRGRQPGPDPARPDRVRAARRQDQHRCHRQQRGCGHLRPRGEHQDPSQRPGHRGRHDGQAAQQAARRDDRRGGPPGPAQQLRAEHRHRQRARPVQGHAPRPAALHAPPGARGPPRPGPGVPAHRPPDPRTPRRRTGPDQPGDGRPAGVHEDHGRRGAAAHLAPGRPVSARSAAHVLPEGAAGAVRGAHRPPPAAPRDHHDRAGQRHGQHRRYDLSAPSARGDRRVA